MSVDIAVRSEVKGQGHMHFAAEASTSTVLASRLTCFLYKTYTVDYKIQLTLSTTTRLLKALTAFLRRRDKLVSNVITKQTRCSAIAKRPRCRVLQFSPKIEDWSWETIF